MNSILPNFIPGAIAVYKRVCRVALAMNVEELVYLNEEKDEFLVTFDEVEKLRASWVSRDEVFALLNVRSKILGNMYSPFSHFEIKDSPQDLTVTIGPFCHFCRQKVTYDEISRCSHNRGSTIRTTKDDTSKRTLNRALNLGVMKSKNGKNKFRTASTGILLRRALNADKILNGHLYPDGPFLGSKCHSFYCMNCLRDVSDDAEVERKYKTRNYFYSEWTNGSSPFKCPSCCGDCWCDRCNMKKQILWFRAHLTKMMKDQGMDDLCLPELNLPGKEIEWSIFINICESQNSCYINTKLGNEYKNNIIKLYNYGYEIANKIINDRDIQNIIYNKKRPLPIEENINNKDIYINNKDIYK
eukprot:GHVL01001023.1.p1 GENE.GHVL01001023.1~~GHVL01001023.1.p1  ORF type:complete len:357 (-),score=80.25 GHVL01001023.1:56-1126(-)